MYFYRKSGKSVCDLRGDFILSHNDHLVKARRPSAAPAGVHNATYIVGVHALSFLGKVRATWAAVKFIWARRSQALTAEAIHREGLDL